MSLKCVGSRTIMTSVIPNVLGDGDVASISAWVRFKSGSWDGADARIFGAIHPDFVGFVCWTKPGQINAQMRNTTGDLVEISPILTLDEDHHLAMTYDGSVVNLYVDAQLFGSRPLAGNLLADSGRFATGLTFNMPTREAEIDDPAFWNGYALTPQDVIDLCDRRKAPTQIAPTSLRFALSLNGPDGQTVADGDAGLTDLGVNAFPVFTTASKPVYSSRAMRFAPSIRVRSIKIGPNRDTLTVELETPDGNAVQIVSFASHPQLTVGSGPAIQLDRPIFDSRHGHITYPLNSPVPVGVAATLDAATRWALTNLGLAAEVVAQAVDTSASGILPAYDPSASRLMGVGMNLSCGSYYGIMIFSANMLEQYGGHVGLPGIVSDADGFLTSASTAGVTTYFSISFDNPVPGRPSYVAAPPSSATGDWRHYSLLYTSDNGEAPSIVTTGPAGGTIVTLLPELSDETGPIKLRTYRVELGSEVTLNLSLHTPSFHARPVAIYPPGIDPWDPPQFYPKFIDALKGYRVLRNLDAMVINHSNITEYDHFHRATALGSDQPTVVRESRVLSIGPDTNPDGFRGSSSVRFTVTTDGPHGFLEGHTVGWRGLTAGPNGDGSFPTTDGGPLPYLGYLNSVAHIKSPTSFTLEVSHNTAATLTRTYSGTDLQATGPAPIVQVEAGRGWTPQKMVDICNEVGADLWFCMPMLMSDAGVTETMAMIAGRLNTGLKVHLELSNEVWNYGFSQTTYVQSMGRLEGLSGAQYYARRAGRVHTLARAAFVAAGRPATDLIRTFGVQGSYSATTIEIADYCVANSIPIDEIAVAPYISIRGPQPEFDRTAEATYRSLSIGQMHDVLQVQLALGDWKKFYATSHRVALDARGFASTLISAYEGSFEYCCLYAEGTALAPAEKGAIARAVYRHPRMTDTYGAWLRAMEEDWGYDTFCAYKIDAVPFNADGIGVNTWCTFWGYEALVDSAATPASVHNVDPDNLPRIVSTTGAALQRYASPAGDGVVPMPDRSPATTYTVSGPATAIVGVPITFILQLASGVLTAPEVITPTPAEGLTFSPASVTLRETSREAEFVVHCTSAGSRSITFTSSGRLINPAARSLEVRLDDSTIEEPGGGPVHIPQPPTRPITRGWTPTPHPRRQRAHRPWLTS